MTQDIDLEQLRLGLKNTFKNIKCLTIDRKLPEHSRCKSLFNYYSKLLNQNSTVNNNDYDIMLSEYVFCASAIINIMQTELLMHDSVYLGKITNNYKSRLLEYCIDTCILYKLSLVFVLTKDKLLYAMSPALAYKYYYNSIYRYKALHLNLK